MKNIILSIVLVLFITTLSFAGDDTPEAEKVYTCKGSGWRIVSTDGKLKGTFQVDNPHAITYSKYKLDCEPLNVDIQKKIAEKGLRLDTKKWQKDKEGKLAYFDKSLSLSTIETKEIK